MNDTEFESHLRGLLRPVAPSAELRERIRENLGARVAKAHAYSGRLTSSKRGIWQVLLRDFGWACAGAAAALAIFAVWPARPAAVSPASPASPSSAPPPAAGRGDEHLRAR
ncbi:MAG: hypothetical protein WDN28_13415 [Chthoniobacter sp.]